MSRTDEMNRTSQTMDDLTQQAKSTYAQVKSSAVDTGKAALTDIKARAADVADTMKDGLEARADVAKDGLADGGKRLAETIRQAGGEQGSIQSKVLDIVATNVADMSEQLRGRDVRSILDDVQGFARRNPALFVAGAAVAGFAVARFLRSSATPEPHGAEVDVYAANMASGMGGMDDAPHSATPPDYGMTGGGMDQGGAMSGGMGAMSGGLGGMSGEGFDAGTSGSMADDAMTGVGDSLEEDDLLRDGSSTAPGTGAGMGGTGMGGTQP